MATIASPPVSPTVAKPLDRQNRKRRHSQISGQAKSSSGPAGDVNATPTVKAGGSIAKPAPASTSPSHTVGKVADEEDLNEEDESADDEDDDELEDVVDSAELESYEKDRDDTDGEILDQATSDRLRARLLELGPNDFLRDTLSAGQMSPQLLGTAFGLNPRYWTTRGEDFCMQALGTLLVRAYHKRRKLPNYNTIDDAAKLLAQSKNIVVITGAGISTSLGIPDFRSQQGFYSQVNDDEELVDPQDVFDLEAFDFDPRIFYRHAHLVLPGEHMHFSPTHAFIRLLQDKGKLLTNYTQNIDDLESIAGVRPDKLVQCHGSFGTATCRTCGHQVPGTHIFPDIRAKRVPRCAECARRIERNERPVRKRKGKPSFIADDSDPVDSDDDNIPEPGVMKPNITFFGEPLPDRFFTRVTDHDAAVVDLVVVIGTTMKVAPVADLPDSLPHAVPHICINREPIRHVEFDLQLLGDCDVVVEELCRKAGWELRHPKVVVGGPAGKRKEGVRVEAVAMDGKEMGHWWAVKREG